MGRKNVNNITSKINKNIRQSKRSVKHHKEESICRLCGDAEISIDDKPRKYTAHEKELFNPCRCRTPAHRYCVKKWDTDKNNKQRGQCEVCGYVYERQVKRQVTCACPTINEVLTRINDSKIIQIGLIIICNMIWLIGIFGYRVDTWFGYNSFEFTRDSKFDWITVPNLVFGCFFSWWLLIVYNALFFKDDCKNLIKSYQILLIALATVATFTIIQVCGWIVVINWWIPHQISFKSVAEDLKYHPNLITFYVGLLTTLVIIIAFTIMSGILYGLKYIGTNVGKWCGQECNKCLIVREITTDDLKECNV